MNESEIMHWTEIRIDYLDEEEGFWYVDAWKTCNDDEEGKSIAMIDDLTGRVIYLDPLARIDKYAQEMIREFLESRKKEEAS